MEVNMKNSNISFSISEIETLDYGKKYKVIVKIPMSDGWIENMNLVVLNDNNSSYFKLDHLKNEDNFVYFSSDVELDTKALYKFYFSYLSNGCKKYIKNDDEQNDIISCDMWKLSVNYDVPNWTKGKVMYHIFVDRFNRGSKEPLEEMPRRFIHDSWDEDVVVGPDKDGIWNNDFYGGDILGIIDKLDYIESLGASILYLSPIVYSQSTHRYDASDYEEVDPYAGSYDDLKLLCEKAHERGMKVVLDAVFNHTGSDSKYFNKYNNPNWGIGAYNDPKSFYSNFYRKHYNSKTNKMEFDYWWGFENLPVCDGNSQYWQDYILGENGIIDKWFKLGIDGLRLDVADELTDDFIEKIRIAVKRNKKDGFILGEVWEDPMTKDNRNYLKSGKGMDSVMNYYLIGSLIKYFRLGQIDELYSRINEIKKLYPDCLINSLMNFTSTHDMTRGINLWDNNLFRNDYGWPWNLKDENHLNNKKYYLKEEDYQKNKDMYEAYVFCLAFMPGILSIFYGDEVGLQGIGNLNNRRTFPWNNIDYDLLDFFKYMGNIRKEEKSLSDASWHIKNINYNYFAFERISKENKFFVIVNRTDKEQEFVVPDEYREPEKVYSLKKSIPGRLNPHGAVALKK